MVDALKCAGSIWESQLLGLRLLTPSTPQGLALDPQETLAEPLTLDLEAHMHEIVFQIVEN
jgi:hypothetical protein